MFNDLRALYSLLTPGQRARLLRLQGLIVVMALAEIAAVLSIGPFMAVVGDMGQLQGEGWLATAYQMSGASNPRTFLSLMGIGVLLVLILAAVVSTLTTWRLSLFSYSVGAELSCRLYRHYLYQPWLFHCRENSSRLINKASQEVQRVTQKIISPAMHVNARLVLVILMSVAIFTYNPVVAGVGLLIFFVSYMLLYKTVRRFLITHGRRISRTQAQRLKLMSEGFGGIKDVLLMHRQEAFARQFDKASRKWARGQGVTQGLGEAPRYAIELVAFGSVILLVLYLLNLHQGNLGSILPALSIYALAGFKMLPAFQKIYSGISSIRGNLAALEEVREDLVASRVERPDKSLAEIDSPLLPAREIRLQDVVFRYPDKAEPALDGLSLCLPARSMVGMVGASGGGKSTAVDLLMGLMMPESGSVTVDGVPIGEDNLAHWQTCISYVPQHIYLTSASIRENVAFGIEPAEIDDARVWEALRAAQMETLVMKGLPDGFDTRVGERGVQLSGGQRQRIGIARALYHAAPILVLDEATSALDGTTERKVMEAIQAFSGTRTIIMIAHRLSTVRHCDCIYLVEKGCVIGQGTYDQLAARNEAFRTLLANA
ncbi:ABC transporter ATP-binding protein [Halomonas ramblicola]|uniref:ABC transporter ATP-binding protein n=1 Tax=Halomonas ramblicola TaxID=747349 RepID=UPI0025B36F54|nr:ABC transporter ATP-binding protein [Halomonas ramblicola]MDN3522066.1 ABC transporter ATP-binding protein [Halomonas ramblicola]